MTSIFSEILKARPEKLIPLLEGEPDEVLWSSDELGAICRHQLNVPIRFELGNMEVERAQILEGAADSKELLLKSFRDLLTHSHPPVRLLKLTHDFAKKHLVCKTPVLLPREIAAVLYYASIVVARVQCHRKISKLTRTDLLKGLQWSLQQSWLDPHLRQVLKTCQVCLDQEAVGTGDPS